MELSARDRGLLAALEEGLPLVPRPFAVLAARIGSSEAEVLERLAQMRASGVFNRMGLIVRHRELGYRANAMVVLDVPDAQLEAAGRALASEPEVALCYARPRRPPLWPYNLFCMVFGREREETERRIAAILWRCGLAEVPRALLFSRRRFVQRGARRAGAGREGAG
ncbi:MAG: AsnC family transcriptional regulator [Geminicoccaceae bacterium]|nr:AsnC family transcriptional regulator [Geminicoccaceae bacterium]MDW8125505.1 AsnC family transcriptional regulator [Geminicoccaceae bacterium]